MSDRYSIKSDDFPQYRLWLKGSASSADPMVFKGEKKADAFLRFSQEHAGVWVGLPGQIKELDALAKEVRGACAFASVHARPPATHAHWWPRDARDDTPLRPPLASSAACQP